jgi:hypothetical protein
MSPHYKNTPLSQENIDQFTSEFQHFGSLWSASWAYVKAQFSRVFLKPFLWQALVTLVPLIAIVTTFGISIARVVIDNQAEIQTATQRYVENDNSEVFRDLAVKLAPLIGGGLFVTLIAILFFAFVSFILENRALYLYNNSGVTSIWKTPRGFYYAALQIIMVNFAVNVVLSIINGLFNNNAGIQLVTMVLNLIFFGFLGLFSYLIIFEEKNTTDSLKESYRLSKPYFWQNTIRWTLASIVIGIGSVLVFVPFVIGIITLLVYLDAVLPVVAILVALLLVAYLLVAAFFIQAFSSAFAYLAFLNLRLLNGRKEEIIV